MTFSNLSFTPEQDINFDSQINWYVQPIEQDMIGYQSNISYYLIPTTVSQELNQTDATLVIQDGNMLSLTLTSPMLLRIPIWMKEIQL